MSCNRNISASRAPVRVQHGVFVFWGYQACSMTVLAATGLLLGATQSRNMPTPEWLSELVLDCGVAALLAVSSVRLVKRKEPHILCG